MTGTKMSPVLCGTLVLLMAAGFLRAEEGYGSGRPAGAVGGGNFGGYAGGLATAGGGGNNVGPTGVAGGYGGSTGGGAGYNNNNGGTGGYGGSTGGGSGYNNNNGGAGGSYDGGELGEPHPYSFQYEVKDPPSGNDYSQQESSDGNTVTGEYRVLLPDGRRQIVKYTANDATGYVADVQYEGEANFVQPTGPGGNYNNNNQQGGGFDNNNQVGYNDNQGGGYNNNNQQGGGYNNQQGGYNNQQPGGSGGYSYRR